MTNKTFSFYTNNGGYSAMNGDQLIIETGNTHFACLVRNEPKDKIVALEWFTHEKDEQQNFEELLKNIKNNSILLDKYYSQTNLYIHNEWSVLVPPALFDKQSAEDHLNIVLGDAFESTSLFDEIKEGDGFVNAYRVESGKLDILNKHLLIDKTEHTYSQLIRKIFADDNLPADFIKVQFYHNEIIVIIFKESKLQFIQTFVYRTSEDVLYYLLSLCERLQLNTEQLVIKVGGVIYNPSPLYSQLQKFFKNVSTETVDLERVKFSTNEYPSHYFTPIFNLAL